MDVATQTNDVKDEMHRIDVINMVALMSDKEMILFLFCDEKQINLHSIDLFMGYERHNLTGWHPTNTCLTVHFFVLSQQNTNWLISQRSWDEKKASLVQWLSIFGKHIGHRNRVQLFIDKSELKLHGTKMNAFLMIWIILGDVHGNLCPKPMNVRIFFSIFIFTISLDSDNSVQGRAAVSFPNAFW